MRHTKTLFLINDQKPQILKLHIFRKNSVSPDDNIHQTLFQILQCTFLLGRSSESAKQIYPHRKFLHTLHKGIIMLLCQNRRRHQIYHLLVFLHCLECCTDGDFCLTISHIPANKAIHDLGAFHILLCGFNGCQLILCLLKRKHFFKFCLPYGVFPVNKSVALGSGCIKLHQILCDILYGSAHLRLCSAPLAAAQFI